MSAMVDATLDRDRASVPTRHPPGLLVLSFTEIWERFSFYGMQALLMLYMVGALLPSHPADRVWGFAGFRTSLEAVFGSLDNQALAAQILGLYAGLVYLTPILGGWIGDRWLGTRRTVLIGAGLMAAGHLLLAFDASFLIALFLLVIGSGCLKGNIATQVGRLYAPDDSRRDRAFLWYAFAINIGAFAGPLVCGALGEKIGWHWGFATAAFGMLIGIAIYAGGARHLPPDRLRGQAIEPTAPLDAAERRRVGALLVAIVLLLGYNIPFGQEYVIVPLWVQGYLDRQVLGFEIPVSWYVAADGFISVAATPFVLALWRWQASRGREPSEIGKIAIGTAMMAAADLLLAVLSAVSPDPRSIFFAWGFVYFLIASTAYLFTMPILLALVSRAAPPKLAATLMGVAYAGLFVANVTIGWMGRFYSPDHPIGFWLSQAGIAAVGVGAAWLLRRPLTRILLRTDQLPDVASA